MWTWIYFFHPNWYTEKERKDGGSRQEVVFNYESMDLIIETLPGKRFDSPKPRPEESVLYARDSSRILLSTMNEIAGRWVTPVVVAVCHVKPGPRKNAADEQRDRERERGRLRKKEATGCIPVAIREWNFKTTAPFIYSTPRFYTA